MAFETAGSIVNDAAIELGLITSAKADIYAETDPNLIQLRALLKRLGRKLARSYEWPQLKVTHTISTTATTTFALPTGFLRMVDGTAWNRTKDRQLIHAAPRQWEAMQALASVGLDAQVTFQISANQLEFFQTQTASETLAFKYVHDLWADTDATLPGTLDAPTAHGHYCNFDSDLLVAGLIYAFKKASGFDTAEALQDYKEALTQVRGGSEPAHSLSLNGTGGLRLIDGKNLPDTGYGS